MPSLQSFSGLGPKAGRPGPFPRPLPRGLSHPAPHTMGLPRLCRATLATWASPCPCPPCSGCLGGAMASWTSRGPSPFCFSVVASVGYWCLVRQRCWTGRYRCCWYQSRTRRWLLRLGTLPHEGHHPCLPGLLVLACSTWERCPGRGKPRAGRGGRPAGLPPARGCRTTPLAFVAW